MPLATLPKTITPGTPENASDVQSNDAALLAALNGQLDGDNLTAAAARAAGISDSTNIRRGSSIIATSESITNAAYAVLTTPDRVSNIVVPSAGILHVSLWAMVTKAVGTAGDNISAAIFIGANQAKGIISSVAETTVGGGVAGGMTGLVYTGVTTTVPDIQGQNSVGAADDTATGHLVGLFIPFVVNAGTYTIEVRWKRSGATAFTALNRKLYVEAKSY